MTDITRRVTIGFRNFHIYHPESRRRRLKASNHHKSFRILPDAPQALQTFIVYSSRASMTTGLAFSDYLFTHLTQTLGVRTQKRFWKRPESLSWAFRAFPRGTTFGDLIPQRSFSPWGHCTLHASLCPVRATLRFRFGIVRVIKFFGCIDPGFDLQIRHEPDPNRIPSSQSILCRKFL